MANGFRWRILYGFPSLPPTCKNNCRNSCVDVHQRLIVGLEFPFSRLTPHQGLDTCVAVRLCLLTKPSVHLIAYICNTLPIRGKPVFRNKILVWQFVLIQSTVALRYSCIHSAMVMISCEMLAWGCFVSANTLWHFVLVVNLFYFLSEQCIASYWLLICNSSMCLTSLWKSLTLTLNCNAIFLDMTFQLPHELASCPGALSPKKEVTESLGTRLQMGMLEFVPCCYT